MKIKWTEKTVNIELFGELFIGTRMAHCDLVTPALDFLIASNQVRNYFNAERASNFFFNSKIHPKQEG